MILTRTYTKGGNYKPRVKARSSIIVGNDMTKVNFSYKALDGELFCIELTGDEMDDLIYNYSLVK